MPTPYPLKVQAIRTKAPRLGFMSTSPPLAAAIAWRLAKPSVGTARPRRIAPGPLHPPQPTTKKRAPKRA